MHKMCGTYVQRMFMSIQRMYMYMMKDGGMSIAAHLQVSAVLLDKEDMTPRACASCLLLDKGTTRQREQDNEQGCTNF